MEEFIAGFMIFLTIITLLTFFDYNIQMNLNKQEDGVKPNETEVKFRPGLNTTQQNINETYVQDLQGVIKNEQQSTCLIFKFFSEFFDIYRFNEWKDKILMIVGIILAHCSGVSYPLYMYFWGKQIDHTIDDFSVLSSTLDKSLRLFMSFLGLAIGSFLINGVVFALWKLLSQRIAYQFRLRYLTAFVKRSIEWVQGQNLYQFATKFQRNCLIIEKATGDKVALFYYLNGVIISGSISALSVRWTFALFLFALIPLGMAVLGYFIYVLIMRLIESKTFFEKAEAHTTQTVALIKTVKMMGGEKIKSEKYEQILKEYAECVKSYPFKLGISTALFYFVQYFMFGVGFMIGIQCLEGTSFCPISATGSHYSAGDMHTVFFEVFVCTYYFLQLASNFQAIKNAIQSSKEIFQFIEQAQVDFLMTEKVEMQKRCSSVKGNYQIPSEIGEIDFINVSFAYPTNPNKKILKSICLKPLRNKFNAIVGSTGSGKSTITQLLLKFYTPDQGAILIGGRNIINVETSWLRERIGFVGQQPTLFSGTLRENVTVGKTAATDDEVWEALRQVNMYEFAMSLPQKLDYDIGFGGQKLSGGQKQRIAIARALIKKPSLLILDEATSALDRKSEKLIQKTLQSIFINKDLNMTVICIAHRVHTIVKADRIFYLAAGSVKQYGIFRELSYFKDIELPAEQQRKQLDYVEEEIIVHNTVLQAQKSNIEKSTEYTGNIYSKLLQYTDNKGWYILSLIMAFINGLHHPAAMLILDYMFNEVIRLRAYGIAFNWCENGFPLDCQATIDDYHNKAMKYLGGLIGFSFYIILPSFFQHFIMTKIEDEITHNLRKDVFSKLMLMPVPWYQRTQNDGGQVALTYGLNLKQVSTLVTTYIPIIVANFTTVAAGMVLCLIYMWKIGLLSFFSIPLIAIGGYVGMIFIGGYDDESLHRYDNSDKLAYELIINIKTAFALNYQNKMLSKYINLIQINPSQSLKRGAKIGFFFGFSIFLIEGSIGVALYSQDHIISTFAQADLLGIMVALTIPMWCGWVAGNNFFFASHASAGKKSAERIFKLLQERTEAQEQQIKAVKIITPPPNEIRGRIEFKGVSFKYPNGKQVLRDINLVIQAGQKAAFVGQSGCGKSTLVLLLQRFYDFEGEITLDGVSIRDYGLATYRSYFSVLNQEPSLFTGTIRENVLFGLNISDQQLEEACQATYSYDVNQAWKRKVSLQRNVVNFLNRQAGVKGFKVSGGEKQRIACARAVLRKPRIFLMDEGTSALDQQTEKLVQQNVDDKLKGVTTVNVAHRIKTIENSDIIFLVEDGRIIQSGKYEELMQRKAYFQKFVQGTKFRTINQIAEHVLMKLVVRLLGLKIQNHG